MFKYFNVIRCITKKGLAGTLYIVASLNIRLMDEEVMYKWWWIGGDYREVCGAEVENVVCRQWKLSSFYKTLEILQTIFKVWMQQLIRCLV